MESTNKTLVSAAGLVALVGTFVYLYLSIIDGYLFSSDPRNQNIERPAASSNASQGQISTTSVKSSSPIDIAARGHAAAVEVMSGKSVGDDLSIFVPQENKKYTGTIEEIIENASGSTSYVGMTTVGDSEYRFVFTEGGGFLFGTLHTPSGRYQYQESDGEGRMVSAATINKNRNFSKPDYVVPKPVTSRAADKP